MYKIKDVLNHLKEDFPNIRIPDFPKSVGNLTLKRTRRLESQLDIYIGGDYGFNIWEQFSPKTYVLAKWWHDYPNRTVIAYPDE